MKRLSLITLLIANVFIARAGMGNFVPGYIVTLKQDTIRGEIDFRTDEANAKKCLFRKSGTGTEKLYLPGEIDGYRITNNGKFYVSRKITIKGRESTVFLEYLIKGLMNVYYYKTTEQTFYFFEKQNGQMQLITKEPDKIVDNQMVEDHKYDGELRYLFRDDIASQYDSKYIDYNQKTMIDIAKKYHHSLCTTGEECIVFENKQPDIRMIECSFTVYAGVCFSQYKISNDYPSLKKYTGLASSPCPLLGLGINLHSPRLSKSFSMLVDISMSGLNIKNKAISDIAKMDISGYVLSPKIGFKYAYPRYKLRPVAELAFEYTSILDAKGRSWEDYNSLILNNKTYRMRTNFWGANGGIGVDYELQKNKFITFRISADLYNSSDALQWHGADLLASWQLKAGYIF
jgi:hypothetical protein